MPKVGVQKWIFHASVAKIIIINEVECFRNRINSDWLLNFHLEITSTIKEECLYQYLLPKSWVGLLCNLYCKFDI